MEPILTIMVSEYSTGICWALKLTVVTYLQHKKIATQPIHLCFIYLFGAKTPGSTRTCFAVNISVDSGTR